MNYHALAPKRYKWSVVSANVHESLEKAKKILEKNQYPPDFYEPIIKQTLTNIVSPEETSQERQQTDRAVQPTESLPKKLLYVQYWGKCTEKYANSLHNAMLHVLW